jgi:hypothetical protein
LVFNSYLAKQLVLNGFQIIDLLKNRDNPNMIIFVFEETKELIDKMIELNNN